MPELPEVETIARGLARRVVGRTILSAEFRASRAIAGDPDRMAAMVAGRRILSVERWGKFMVLDLGGDCYLTIHLGMTGQLRVDGEPAKHTHAIFTLDRGGLVFDDPRMFGKVEVTPVIPARVAGLGPEPLQVAFDDFYAAMRGRKVRIKSLLLNQRFLRGVGNIYADESLFRAGIHPFTLAGRIRKERAARLHQAIRDVLTEAIALGGSSISDYVDAEGHKGFFQLEHRVYQRHGEPCKVCGSAVRRALVAARGTHYCPKCQR